MHWIWKALIVIALINDFIGLCMFTAVWEEIKKLKNVSGINMIASLFGMATKKKEDNDGES